MSIQMLIKEHQKLNFPWSPTSDELADWIHELSEQEAYYLGLIQSGTLTIKNLDSFHEFKSILDGDFTDLTADDYNILSHCKQYALSLENLMMVAVRKSK